MKYSQEEINFIVESYKNNTRTQVVEFYKNQFGKSISTTTVGNIARIYGDYKKEIRKYSQEQINYLKEIYKTHSVKECVQLLKKKYDLDFTVSKLKNYLHKYRIHSNRDTRFQKGNKLSSEHYEKIKDTMFKKGQKSHNSKPIGYEKQYGNYVLVKTNDKPTQKGKWMDNWTFKQRYVYEQNFGSIPEGCLVVFADGNNKNFEPDNLVLVTQQELLYMNNHDLYLKNNNKLNKYTATIAKLNLKIYEKENKNAKNNT